MTSANLHLSCFEQAPSMLPVARGAIHIASVRDSSLGWYVCQSSVLAAGLG